MKNPLPRLLSRISTKLLLFVVLVVVIPLVIAGNFLLKEVEESFIEQSLRDFQLLAEAQEGQALLFLDELEIRTVDSSADAFIEDSVEKINSLEDGSERDEIKTMLNDYLISHKLPIHNDIIGISILDLNGNFLEEINLRDISDGDLHPNFVKKFEDLKKGEGTHGGIFIVTEGGNSRTAIAVATNIYKKNTNEKIGTLINYFDMKILSDVLIGEYQIELGAITGLRNRTETLDIYLVNHQKYMVSRSRFFGDRTILKQIVDTVPVNACISNKEELVGIWDDYRGISVMGAAMCLSRHGDLTLIVEIDEAEILKPILELEKKITFGILILLIFMIISGIIFSSRLSRPIVKLTQVADDISKGKLHSQVDKEILDDKSEIGDLARAFNRTVVSLKLAMRKSGDTSVKEVEESGTIQHKD